MCEHHLMPFFMRQSSCRLIIAKWQVTGLSKLARTVDVYARRPQIQERLTVQIADALERTLNPKGDYGNAGSGTHLHDHAWNQKTRK